MEVIDGKALYGGHSLATWARDVANRIVERFDVDRIVLFGSVARDDDGPDSDIDLLLVMPIVGRRHDTTVRVLSGLRDVVVPIDITVVDPAHLDEEASVPGIVAIVAIREGQTLAVNERRRNMIEHSGTTASRCRGVEVSLVRQTPNGSPQCWMMSNPSSVTAPRMTFNLRFLTRCSSLSMAMPSLSMTLCTSGPSVPSGIRRFLEWRPSLFQFP